MKTEYKCPKCGGEIEDLTESDEWMYFTDEPFRCCGHYTGRYPNVSKDCSMNRTKSCGYFSLEELKKGE
ncbi:hypothetical protein [Pasteurella multocida]|uniref:hypothetical protein n=1 Tax=Pasteurella multocida TaxID=747 RepID=UPI001F530904|nr:hypothetical protein [Pasteurella multocida]